MKELIALLCLLTTPAFACNFEGFGTYTCYKDEGRRTEMYSLTLEKAWVNNIRSLKMTRKYKDDGSTSAMSFSMGAFSQKYDELFKNRVRKAANDNVVIDPFSFFWDDGIGIGHYQGENSCSKNIVSLNSQYFKVIATENGDVESDVKKTILITKNGNSLSFLEDYKERKSGKGQFKQGNTYKEYCFKN